MINKQVPESKSSQNRGMTKSPDGFVGVGHRAAAMSQLQVGRSRMLTLVLHLEAVRFQCVVMEDTGNWTEQ